ncbi:MAG: hypothetical protein IKE70_05715 [Bacilli bacterium]|nr:hypothetical protein [Bacilli bacterium]
MIKTIEIIIKNGIFEKIRCFIVWDKNICYFNEKKIMIEEEWKERLLRTIRLWKKEYGALNGIDQEEFKITIISDVEETIHGKGVFPNNYQEFMELLGELNDKK